MVGRLQQLGWLSAGEAGQFLEASGQLRDDIVTGEVDCSSESRYNILDWIASWYSLDAPSRGNSDDQTTVQSVSSDRTVRAAVLIYPNPTFGRVSFSRVVDQVRVYDMMGRLMTKAENTDHLDLHAYPSGVYVIRTIDIDGERNVQRLVKR